MPYGIIKIDTVTFTDAGVDKSVTLSGLVQNPTFSGNVTVTGTLSGVTVTGTTANFTSGNFTNISGGTHTITSGVFAAGSAASPSITFTGDLNTGIYSPGADQVAISTGGSGRLFVDANGRVGINSAPSLWLLEVKQDSASSAGGAYPVIQVNNPNANGYAGVYLNDSTAQAGLETQRNTGHLGLQAGGSERLRITSAGLVGIGTSTIRGTSLLDARGDISFGSNASYYGLLSYNAGTGHFESTSSDGGFKWIRASGPATSMTLDSSGRLGIGTTSPVSPLHIATGTAATGRQRIQSGDGTNANRFYVDIGFNTGLGANNDFSINAIDTLNGNNVGPSIIFGTQGSFSGSTATERARIDSFGRLLVGTSTVLGTGGLDVLYARDSYADGLYTGQLGAFDTSAYNSGPVAGVCFGFKYNAAGSYAIAGNVQLIKENATDGNFASAMRFLTRGSTGDVAERLRITSAGLVGVGTSSPTEKLDVAGNIAIPDNFKYILGSFGGENSIRYGTPGTTGMYFKTSGSDRVVITAGGSVGIGTTQLYGILTARAATNCNFHIRTPSDVGSSGEGVAIDSLSDNAGGVRPLVMRATSHVFFGESTERARIDSSGRLLVGTSSARSNFYNTTFSSRFQVEGANDGNARSLSCVYGQSNASGPIIILGKHRADSVGGTTIVNDGDELGALTFQGSDGTEFVAGAQITAYVDGTPGTNDMPGRLVFSTTADGASSPTERLRITSAGLVGVGTSSPAEALDVVGKTRVINNTGATNTGDQNVVVVGATTSGAFSSTYGAGLQFQITNSSGGYSGPRIVSRLNADNNTANLVFQSRNYGFSDAMTLDSSGRLGIGTTSPGALLDTRGSIRLGNQGSGDGTTAISSSNGVYIGVNHDTTTTTVVPLQIGGYPAAPSYSGTPDHAIVLDGWSGSTIYHNAIVNRKGRELSFHTAITGNGFSDTNERARIDSSGRLLVGTSSTVRDSRLCVRGNASGSFTGDLELGAAAGYASISVDNTIGVLRFTESTNGGIFAQLYAESDGTPGNNDYPGRLVFSTTADGASSPTERMRINNSGDLLYGVTSFTNAVKGFLISGTTGRTYITCNGDTVLDLNRLSNTGEVAAFRTASTQVGSITVTGSATAYNTSSDYRLKENVTAVTDGITRLQQLKPSRFNFIAEPDKTVDGFIAHEVQAVVPEAITGKKDAEDEDGNPIYQGIDQSKLVPLLTAALQEAIGEIESLKARVAALESA